VTNITICVLICWCLIAPFSCWTNCQIIDWCYSSAWAIITSWIFYICNTATTRTHISCSTCQTVLCVRCSGWVRMTRISVCTSIEWSARSLRVLSIIYITCIEILIAVGASFKGCWTSCTLTIACFTAANVIVTSSWVGCKILARLTWLWVNISCHGRAIVTFWARCDCSSCATNWTCTTRFTIINRICRTWETRLERGATRTQVILSIVTVVCSLRVLTAPDIFNVATNIGICSSFRHKCFCELRALQNLNACVVIILSELRAITTWNSCFCWLIFCRVTNKTSIVCLAHWEVCFHVLI